MTTDIHNAKETTLIPAPDKHAIRRRIRGLRNEISPDWVASHSRTISEYLLQLPEFRKAETICLYLALPGEVSLEYALEACLEKNRHVLVPAYRPESDDYGFKQINPGTPMRSGPWDVPEPDTPHWAEPTGKTAIVVPGVAFDEAGHRIGHGKGYYDRLLAKARQSADCFNIGICFDFQKQKSLPTEPWDIDMDAVISEKGSWNLNRTKHQQTQ